MNYDNFDYDADPRNLLDDELGIESEDESPVAEAIIKTFTDKKTVKMDSKTNSNSNSKNNTGYSSTNSVSSNTMSSNSTASKSVSSNSATSKSVSSNTPSAIKPAVKTFVVDMPKLKNSNIELTNSIPYESVYTTGQLTHLKRTNKGQDLSIFKQIPKGTIPVYILSPLPDCILNNPGKYKKVECATDVNVVAKELQLGEYRSEEIKESYIKYNFENGYIFTSIHGINNYKNEPGIYNTKLDIKYYFKNGKLHDFGGVPAINGPYEKVHLSNGVLNKLIKNDKIVPNRIVHLVDAIDSKGEPMHPYPIIEYYYEKSYLSRENGPSIIVYSNDKPIAEAWFNKGIVSRNPERPGYIYSGPALINISYYDNESLIYSPNRREYIYDGNYYRVDNLPEVEYNNIKEWRTRTGLRGFDGEKDEPAMIINGTTKIWFKNDKIHRSNDRPAMTFEKSEKYPNGRFEYYTNGARNREGDLPAVIEHPREYVYYKRGLETRDYRKGPSGIFIDSENRVNKRWMQNGKPYRPGKPFYMREDGLVLYKYTDNDSETEHKDIMMDPKSPEFVQLFFE